ncbi:hypothetical protein N7481_005484 [Penicillium waksmanii]|uniref:uncharacterized protein n=1 Tax=Penicillium waksmanii TaxID=69791 RepID=UPI0025483CAD|nr:uncharacterized protein N7481_005484 [Penicillium waksmanii]KAJ5983385.1 hypothetical protein N7481_005484 [Penicillium waksmanii]
MEASIRQLQDHSSSAPIDGKESSEGPSRGSEDPLKDVQDSSTASAAAPDPRGENTTEPLREIDVSESSVDGMGALQFTDEENCGFFGDPALVPSSSQRTCGTVNGAKSPSTGRPVSVENINLSAAVNIYALPSEERTWSLIQQYFHKTGQLLPFIHEKSFCETYFQMKKERFRKVRRTWLGLLNIVLAIAASLSTKGDMPAEKRIQESDVYYQRANGLCDRDSKRNASLEMVQYLLILGQYLQGTQKSVQAWTAHGLAISAAYQLGLHSPDANRGFPPAECETRKRTWFGCVLLDRKLYVILYNVLESCYGANLGFEVSTSPIDAMSGILEGQRQLDEWRLQQLPSLGLKVCDSPLSLDDVEKMDTGSIIRHRFEVVLSVRYNNLRILVHRRCLESLLDPVQTQGDTLATSETRLLQQMGLSSVISCVESAMSIISIVHNMSAGSGWRREFLGAWNYSLYYTFNAALVIFGSLIVASKERDRNPSAWIMVSHSRPCIDTAAEALRQLDPGNPVVERCQEYLSQLSAILDPLS